MIRQLIPLYQDKWRFVVLYGGRASGKSWGIAAALIYFANKSDCRILCVREIQNSIRDSSYQLLLDTIARMGLSQRFVYTRDAIICKSTGSRFIFRGLSNNPSLKSLEGVNYCWVEEAQTVSEDSWLTLIPTIRSKGSRIFISFNPDRPDDPTYKRFVLSPPPRCSTQKLNYEDNPYFKGTALEEEMEYMKRVDYEAYLHIWEGQPRTNSDAQIFRGKYRVESFPDDLWKRADRLFFGADFGFSKDPSTLLRCFMLNRNLYIDYEAYGHGVEIDELGSLYRNSVPECDQWPIICDSARPETISYLRNRLGFNARAAKKWQGSIEDGIAYLRSFEAIVIHPRCRHTAEEFSLYSYKVDKRTGDVLNIVEDKWNHCIDSVRYALDGYITHQSIALWERIGKKNDF